MQPNDLTPSHLVSGWHHPLLPAARHVGNTVTCGYLCGFFKTRKEILVFNPTSFLQAAFLTKSKSTTEVAIYATYEPDVLFQHEQKIVKIQQGICLDRKEAV